MGFEKFAIILQAAHSLVADSSSALAINRHECLPRKRQLRRGEDLEI